KQKVAVILCKPTNRLTRQLARRRFAHPPNDFDVHEVIVALELLE
ncbi:hypothetical protein F442_17053, partial [Phytophthora nicotianae P10297]